MYQYILEHYPNDQLDDVKVPIYIGIERIIYKSDDATIRSRLFRMAFAHNILLITTEPMRLLTPKELDLAIEKSAEKLYSKAGKRLSRAIWRSLIFLILTKAIVGLAVEIPYDLLVYDEIILIPILINLLFPPIYLLLSSSLILMPGRENTQRVGRLVQSMFYENHTPKPDEISDKDEDRMFERLFNLVYTLISVAIFAGLTTLLLSLEFNIVGLGVFFIYFSSVSYFSFRITNGVREPRTTARTNGMSSSTVTGNVES